MPKRLLVMLMVVAMVLLLIPGIALAGDGGQAIGQDPARLALTRCANAGPGDGGEFESGVGLFFWLSLKSDCLDKFGYTISDLEPILEQSSCEWLGPFLFVCEVDPGNSAAHNANNT